MIDRGPNVTQEMAFATNVLFSPMSPPSHLYNRKCKCYAEQREGEKPPLYVLWPSIKEGKMTSHPNKVEMKHIFNRKGEIGGWALAGSRGWYSLNLPGRLEGGEFNCSNLRRFMPPLPLSASHPAMRINKMEGCLSARPAQRQPGVGGGVFKC